MLIEARPNGANASEPKHDRAGSACRAIWVGVALAMAVLTLGGLYVGGHPAEGPNAGHFRRLFDFLPEAAAVGIFTMTYLVLATGRLPGFRLDRAGAALVGASLITAVLSNIVSNVPAVLVLKPFIARLPDQQQVTVAMASALAGNFAVVGSVANLIVVQRARARKIEIGFWAYSKVGVPLTLLTIGVGMCWLSLI
jgi:hypothetical protein